MNNSISKWASATLLASVLAGCGGGDDPDAGNPPVTPPAAAKYSIGGTVSGLKGSLVLRSKGNPDLTMTADGTFVFENKIESGKPYVVTIQAQPAAQECTIARDSGIVASQDVTDVAVTCGGLLTTELQAVADVKAVKLNWRSPRNATAFNVYVASTSDCDIKNYAACPDGAMLANVTSPRSVDGLRNGQAYYFKVEATLADGTLQVSNQVGARPNGLAFNNLVHTTAFGADGTVYIGGEFTSVGIASGGFVSLDAGTGQPKRADFPIVSGDVSAIIPDGAGGWYVGGRFSQIDDRPHRNLAHILAGGAVDPAFNATVDGLVSALALSGDTLYFGGDFSEVNGIGRNRLAAVGTDGVLREWNPEADNWVRALAIADDVVYAGGDFSGIGPEGSRITRHHLAAIGSNGVLLPWDPNALGGTVSALAISGNTVYAGGSFGAVSGQGRGRVAAISTSGELVDWRPNVNGRVQAIAVSGGIVYLGGPFSLVEGKPRNGLAAVEAAGLGSLRDEWHPDVAGLITSLAVSDDRIYAGGGLLFGDGTRRSGVVAAVSKDGRVLDWRFDPNSTVEALAISGETLSVGGNFTGIHGAERNHLAAIDAQGRLLDWNPGATGGGVNVLAISGTTLYAGGDFSHVAGATRHHLAAIDADGTLLDWSPSADGTVDTLLVSGTTVYVGGAFVTVDTAQGSQDRKRLAAISTDGDLLPWNPSANDRVFTLAMSGSTVYAGGRFTQVTTSQGPKDRNHLVAIDADGQVLDTWNPDVSGVVGALAVSGSTVYVGGGFHAVGSQEHQNLAAVGIDGTVLDWTADTDFHVVSLALSGSTLYAGGAFTTITTKAGLQTRNRLAAIDANANLLDWNPNANEQVNMVRVSNGIVYAGGYFSMLQGLSRRYFGAIEAAGGDTVIP